MRGPVERFLHMDRDGHKELEETRLKEGYTDDYAKIADEAGLTGIKKDVYVQYMQSRWPKGQDASYADEWAGRFQMGTEWHNSDSEGQAVLTSAAPKIYPPKAAEGKIPDIKASAEKKIDALREAGDPADVIKYRQLLR